MSRSALRGLGRFTDTAKKARNLGDLAKRFAGISDAAGIGRNLSRMFNSMNMAQAAMKAWSTFGDVAKRGEAAKAVGAIVRRATDVPTRTVLRNVAAVNEQVMESMALISQASSASFRKMKQLLGSSGDVAKKFDEAVKKIRADLRLGMAGITKKNPIPQGLKRVTKFCSENPISCAAATVGAGLLGMATFGVGDSTATLTDLDNNERKCIDACLPRSKEGETPVVYNELTEEEKKGGLFVCDGAEATGETYADCKEYCVANCTSLESKCNLLGNATACDVLKGADDTAGDSPGSSLDTFWERLGLGNLADIYRYIIMAVAGIIVVVVLYFVFSNIFGSGKGAPSVTIVQQQPVGPPGAAAVPVSVQ